MHPYGSSAYRSSDSTSEVSARRYRYTGKERDEATGLDYFGARYYAPWLGRWTTADPLGLQAGLNLYLYGRASPVVFNDPTGLDAKPGQVVTRPDGSSYTVGGADDPFANMVVPTEEPAEPSDDGSLGGALALAAAGPIWDVDDLGPAAGVRTAGLPAPFESPYWRKVDLDVVPDPTIAGFQPTAPKSSLSPALHALGEIPPEGSPYLSLSRTPGGAPNIAGTPFAVDIQSVRVGAEVIENEALATHLEKLAAADPSYKTRVAAWKAAQAAGEAEVLVKAPIGPGAVESVAVRGLKGVGRGLFWVGVAATVADVGVGAKESIDTGSGKPLGKAVIRQAGGWGGALAGAKAGAIAGAAVSAPTGPGALIGGLIGSVAGGFGGYFAGDWLAEKVLE